MASGQGSIDAENTEYQAHLRLIQTERLPDSGTRNRQACTIRITDHVNQQRDDHDRVSDLGGFLDASASSPNPQDEEYLGPADRAAAGRADMAACSDSQCSRRAYPPCISLSRSARMRSESRWGT